MKQEGILKFLEKVFLDKHADNMNIPLYLILTLTIATELRSIRNS
jgi:hypothetical protein